MELTKSQEQALKTFIFANYQTQLQQEDYSNIADRLNAKSATKAWRVAVPGVDSDEAPSYTTYDSLQAGKRDSWALFLKFDRNFSKNKVRAWVVDVWGNATAGSNAEAVLNAGTEFASVAEGVLGGTVKTTGTVSALDRDFVGYLDLGTVAAIITQ